MAFKRSPVRSRLSPPTKNALKRMFRGVFAILMNFLNVFSAMKFIKKYKKRTKKRTNFENAAEFTDYPEERMYQNGKH